MLSSLSSMSKSVQFFTEFVTNPSHRNSVGMISQRSIWVISSDIRRGNVQRHLLRKRTLGMYHDDNELLRIGSKVPAARSVVYIAPTWFSSRMVYRFSLSPHKKRKTRTSRFISRTWHLPGRRKWANVARFINLVKDMKLTWNHKNGIVKFRENLFFIVFLFFLNSYGIINFTYHKNFLNDDRIV